jgi:large subunit ribosomal protein L5
MNKMKEIRIEKITLNIGTGESGKQLENAMKLLQILTEQKPVATRAKDRIPTWGVRPGLTIGTKVTIRNKQDETLKNMLVAIANKISARKIGEGTLSFGIPEYIEIPGSKYDIDIGIIGLGVMVTLERPGFRVKKRSLKKSKLPTHHLISKEETIEFLKTKFDIEVME